MILGAKKRSNISGDPISCLMMSRDSQLVNEKVLGCDRFCGSPSRLQLSTGSDSACPPVPAYILSNKDITCLCLIRNFLKQCKCLISRMVICLTRRHYGSCEIGFGSSAIDSEIPNEEKWNNRGVLELSCPGRGARATGGWVFDETLRRRVRLHVFFAPSVAKCPDFSFPARFLRFFVEFSSLIALISYQFIDIAYLCLITFFKLPRKILDDSQLTVHRYFDFGSFAI